MSPLVQFLLAACAVGALIGFLFFMASGGPRDGSSNSPSDGGGQPGL